MGLDVCLHVAKILSGVLRAEPPQLLADKVAAGKLGARAGAASTLWRRPGGQAAAGSPAPDDDLVDRLVLPLVNEAVAFLREGVVADEDLIDAGAIFGSGSHRSAAVRCTTRANADTRRRRQACSAANDMGHASRRTMAGIGCARRRDLVGTSAGARMLASALRDSYLELSDDQANRTRAARLSPLDGLKQENLHALVKKTDPRRAARRNAVQGRRHRQAHGLPGERHRRAREGDATIATIAGHAAMPAIPSHRSCRAAKRRSRDPTSSTSRSTATCSTS